MDMKSFARGKKKTSAERQNVKEMNREELEKTVGELGKKSESELMSELMSEVRRGRNDGSFTPEALDEFVKQVAPMLTPEQQRRMERITANLKV